LNTLDPDEPRPDRRFSERRQLDRALRECEERYRLLFDAIDEGFCIVEVIFDKDERPIDYRFLQVNAAFEKQTGLIDAQGKRMRELAPKHEEHWFEIYGKIALTGQPARFTNRAEQLHRWYDVYAFRVGQPEDRQVGILFSDITERKQAEELLRLTQLAVDHSPDFVHWFSREGRCLYVNDSSCRRLGYSREELLGMTVYDIDPGAPQPWSSHFQEVKERGSFTFESSLRTKAGEIIPVDVTVSYVNYGGQDYNCATSRDITERKRAEEALRKSEEEYRTVADFTYDWEAWRSPDGTYRYVSPACERITGHTVAEFMADSDLVVQITHPDDRLKVIEHYRAADHEAREQDLEFDHRILTTGGETRWIGHSCTPVYDERGQWLGRRASNRDITTRKKAEEQLRESEERLLEAQHLGKIGNWEWIPADDKVIWSAEMYAIFGVAPEADSLTTEMSMQAFHPEDRVMVAEAIRKTLEQRTSEPIECRILKPDGTIGYVYGRGEAVLDAEGQLVKMTGIYQDITAHKQAEEALREREEQLRQSQKMEAVGQLAGGIAHDFNNLLTSVLGYSELLLSDPEFATTAWHDDVVEIRAAGQRAGALTKQILAFSRRQALRPDVVLLNEVLAGMELLLRRTLGENIDLVSLQHPDLGHAEIDVHQFEQVLMNLAINARDAMPAGGRLTLETANVELDEEYCRTHPEVTPGSYVMLAVSDTGIGMDETTLGHAFEPFFTTKAPGEGTGLGLATVYGIVKQSRGNIFVYSEPGKGTTFKIYLPRVATREAAEVVVLREHASNVGNEVVMVVEDESSLRTLIERVLSAAGYTVICFGSADEAMVALQQGREGIDLLLTDVVLPGVMQGNDLARVAQNSRPGLPVLYMSGYTRDAIVHAGRLDEGINFLEKPFTPEALARMVREVLDQESAAG
jgi:two-component system cell cycle sensor histidine kinase/response regulator CckA